MTIRQLEALVLRLAALTTVRYFRWLNHPKKPRLMGLRFAGGVSSTIADGLIRGGFRYDTTYRAWVIEETEG